jgi:hypothetical protein
MRYARCVLGLPFEKELEMCVRARDGDQDVAWELAKGHEPKLRGWIRARISLGQRDDVHQSTLVRIVTRFGRFDPARVDGGCAFWAFAHWEARAQVGLSLAEVRRETELSVDPTKDDEFVRRLRYPAAALMRRYLTIGLESDHPANQRIAFAFVSGFTYSPKGFLAAFSDVALRDVASELGRLIVEVHDLHLASVTAFSTHPDSGRTLGSFINRGVDRKPAQQVSDWVFRVKASALNQIRDGLGLKPRRRDDE